MNLWHLKRDFVDSLKANHSSHTINVLMKDQLCVSLALEWRSFRSLSPYASDPLKTTYEPAAAQTFPQVTEHQMVMKTHCQEQTLYEVFVCSSQKWKLNNSCILTESRTKHQHLHFQSGW